MKSLLALIIAFNLAMPAGDAMAAGLLDTVRDGGLDEIGSGAYGETGEPSKDIISIIIGVVRVFLGLLGIIFVILVITAGFKWMSSQGDSAKLEAAKKQLSASVIGLVLTLAAWGITVFVVGQVINATTKVVAP